MAASQPNEEKLVLKNFDSDHVVLMYSADDKICRPLQKLYDRMMHIYKGSWMAEGMSDDEFKKYGFEIPEYLRDHPYNPAGIWNPEVNLPSFDSYYRIRLDSNSEPRIVRVQDTQWGAQDVRNRTNVYVLKPHLDINNEKLEDEEIAFGVIFGHSENTGFPQINLPYYFSRGRVYKNYTWILGTKNTSNTYYIQNYDIGLGGYGRVVQRVFEFQGEAVFIARSFAILVYRINDQNVLDDTCYLSPSVIKRPHVDMHRRHQ